MISLRDAPARDLLGVYLNDHLAGETALVALARRTLRRNRTTPLGDVLRRLVPELDEDRAVLVDLLDRLGMPERRWKRVAASAAERAGRAKLNGQLLGYSDLSRLVELEGLIVGCRGKHALWQTLAEIGDEWPEMRGLDVGRLMERASSQIEALEQQRRAAAHTALGADSGDAR